MTEVIFRKNELTEKERNFFQKMNPGFSVTGDVLYISYGDGNRVGYVIFKGLYTKSNMCRECSKYYEVALQYGYVRINKKTLEVL